MVFLEESSDLRSGLPWRRHLGTRHSPAGAAGAAGPGSPGPSGRRRCSLWGAQACGVVEIHCHGDRAVEWEGLEGSPDV